MNTFIFIMCCPQTEEGNHSIKYLENSGRFIPPGYLNKLREKYLSILPPHYSMYSVSFQVGTAGAIYPVFSRGRFKLIKFYSFP